jgi:hypothetical protein
MAESVGDPIRFRESGFEIQGRRGAKDFLFFRTVQTGSGAHSVFYSVGTGIIPWVGGGCQGVLSTSHFLVVSRLRMSGAIPLVPLNAFEARTWRALPFLRNLRLKALL